MIAAALAAHRHWRTAFSRAEVSLICDAVQPKRPIRVSLPPGGLMPESAESYAKR
jgi:hypothetical protein